MTQCEPAPISAPRAAYSVRERNVEMLIAASIVVLMAYLLEVRGDRVNFIFLSQYPLPQSCLSRELFNIECPACGLTRSIVYLAHGRLTDSFRAHHIGWIMALAILLQFPYRVACLRRSIPPFGKKFPKLFGLTLITLLIVNWLMGIVGLT